MIDKVVSSIIEAEECAKVMIEKAEKDASDLLADAERAIEQQGRQAAEENKKYLSEQLQQFLDQSADLAQKHFEQNKQIIEKQINAYRAGIDAAVKKIIGNI